MNIALICAFNPNQNSGMYTVDRAAEEFFSDRSDINISYYSLGDVSLFDDGAKNSDIEYQSLIEQYDNIIAADLILFWGDFLHSYSYWQSDLVPRMMAHKLASSHEQAQDILCKHLLFEDSDQSILKKVVIYGSTLIPDTAKDFCDERYFKGIERLFSQCRGIYFREAFSAARFSYLRPFEVIYGTDCALLNSHKYPPHQCASNTIGIYFGRSGRWERIKFFFIARKIAKLAGKKLKWISWFPIKPRDRIDAKWLTGETNIVFNGGMDTVNELKNFEFVITDVYHTAVNAWARSIPTILFGSSAGSDTDTVGSKKKETLYFQYLNQRNYVYWESITPRNYRKLARKLVANITDQAHNESVIYNIKNSSLAATLRLKKTIFGDGV